MINLFKSKKVFKIILLIILVYTAIIVINQQTQINDYNAQKTYHSSQISTLLEEQEELKEKEASINSPKFIEEQAREKLDMYYPNERVYIIQGN